MNDSEQYAEMRVMSSQDMVHPNIGGTLPMKPVLGSKNYTNTLGR